MNPLKIVVWCGIIVRGIIVRDNIIRNMGSSFFSIGVNRMNDRNQIFSEKLRAIRTSKKISQDKLAVATKIDRSYVGRIDRGEVNITLDILYKIAIALDCEPTDLLPNLEKLKETEIELL